MVDRTDISGLGIEYDFFNGLFFLLIGFSSAAMGLYGLNTGDFQLFGAGASMGLVLLVAAVLLQDSLLTSPATAFQASFSFWAARFLAFLSARLFDVQYSFYSTASDSYFSTALSDAPQWLKTYLNGHMAPYLENYAIFGEILVFFGILQATGGINNVLPFANIPEPFLSIIHFGLAILGGGVTFAVLHGVEDIQNSGFFFRAIVLMAIMAGTLIASDKGWISLAIFPVTFAATYGYHGGINIQQAGGLWIYYTEIGGATGAMGYVVQGAFLLELLTAGVVLWGLVQILVGAKSIGELFNA